MDRIEKKAVDELEKVIVKLKNVKGFLFSQIKTRDNIIKELQVALEEVVECHRCKEIDGLDTCVLEMCKQAIKKAKGQYEEG